MLRDDCRYIIPSERPALCGTADCQCDRTLHPGTWRRWDAIADIHGHLRDGLMRLSDISAQTGLDVEEYRIALHEAREGSRRELQRHARMRGLTGAEAESYVARGMADLPQI